MVRKDKPEFTKNVIMLDDHLFSIDLENWKASIATPDRRVEVSFYMEHIMKGSGI